MSGIWAEPITKKSISYFCHVGAFFYTFPNPCASQRLFGLGIPIAAPAPNVTYLFLDAQAYRVRSEADAPFHGHDKE
jgi:hypothetical protein